MAKVLVTGGTGFVGKHVIANLKAKGQTPIVLDRRFDPALADIEGIYETITNPRTADGAVAEADAVIHLAGILGTQETLDYPRIALEVNIIGSLNVFEAVKRYKVPAVYVTVGNYWMNNPYSISKYTAERLALMFNAEFGTHIAVVRAYNAYGPGQKPGPVRKIIPNFIIPALKGETITIYGNGEQIMDMIYVEDLAEILVRALDAKYVNHVYEAGTGRRTTVNEIANVVLEKVGWCREYQVTDGSVRRTDHPIERVPMRPGEEAQATVLANPDTLGLLAPPQFVTLEDGIERTIPYYRERL